MRYKRILLVSIFAGVLLLILGVYNSLFRKADSWGVYLPGVASFSSPRTADLNGDGILDIVIGAGSDEFRGCDSAIVAFDGKSGEVLWHVSGRDQMVGSAIFSKIDADEIPDIILSGRAGQLRAVSGKDGSLIWSYYSEEDFQQFPDSVFLNFYASHLVPDIDHDELPDLLVANGGDATIPRYVSDRPVGQLLLVNTRTGKCIVQAPMPDGAETYMTPLCTDLSGDGQQTVIFGSGGETLSGHLYRIPLDSMLTGDLSSATVLATGKDRGFMAPPVLADITGDGTLDIIANAIDGRMIALDGSDNQVLWEVGIPNAEVYGSIAVGNFTGDATPDFFSNFGVGIFPEVVKAYQLMVDGHTGQVEFLDSLGYIQIGSPLAADIDDDGWDEALMSMNSSATQEKQNIYTSLFGIQNQLLVFHFGKKSRHTLLGPFVGVNPASTPWIGDLDGDSQLDILYAYMADTLHYLPFNGMKLLRKEIDVDPLNVHWGGYMGTHGNGKK
uniref:PQQ-binding-like beta-propeller repeat protein n=1 Tax=Roseihalotalea indica TaxID=2867963 RepID=A0AA49JDR6_9BACT|nr:PQQ-binding-like beta-propeller repeat protein [Tunicatimonas sp. TK19036]